MPSEIGSIDIFDDVELEGKWVPVKYEAHYYFEDWELSDIEVVEVDGIRANDLRPEILKKADAYVRDHWDDAQGIVTKELNDKRERDKLYEQELKWEEKERREKDDWDKKVDFL